jgi:hypothetical protein
MYNAGSAHGESAGGSFDGASANCLGQLGETYRPVPTWKLGVSPASMIEWLSL